jgi:hypothetical protein
MATPHSTLGNASFPTTPLDEAEAQDSTLSQGAPAKTLFGVLPIKRVIPTDVHAVMDYTNSAVFGAGAIMTSCPEARLAGIVLGAAGASVSLMTDYRLSAAKVIPIEAHEVIDHAWGLMAIAAPFVLGYWKKAPLVAAAHVFAGASTILASLFTDYRAYSKRRR